MIHGPVAQLVERLPEEQGVVGSSPAGTTKTILRSSNGKAAS